MPRKSRWLDYEGWSEFGLKQGYEDKSPSSIKNSEDSLDRSWYVRGRRMKWLGEFDFDRVWEFQHETYDEWKNYGIENNYNDRSPNELQKSSSKNERCWYKKGHREQWLKDFSFSRIVPLASENWDTVEEWSSHGIEEGYHKRNPTSLTSSMDANERIWYNKGRVNRWLDSFSFRKRLINGWQGLEFTLGVARKLLEENSLEDLPSALQLRVKFSRSDLSAAISKYHGGFPVFREKLREYMGHETNQDNLGSLLEEYVGGNEE